jgi:hypothetical protein
MTATLIASLPLRFSNPTSSERCHHDQPETGRALVRHATHRWAFPGTQVGPPCPTDRISRPRTGSARAAANHIIPPMSDPPCRRRTSESTMDAPAINVPSRDIPTDGPVRTAHQGSGVD